jgi:hypothetical protein
MTHNKKFYFFHYTRKSMNSCCNAMDTGIPADASDAQRGEQCRNECQWCCWPMIFVVDIITLPYRGPKHLIKKCMNKSTTK